MSFVAFDLLARAVLLLSAAWLVVIALRKRSAALRALVWTSAFAGLLLLPGLSRVTPALNVPVLAPIADDEPNGGRSFPGLSVVEGSSAVHAGSNRRRQGSGESAVASAKAEDPASLRPRSSISWSALAFALWASVAVVLVARIMASHVAVTRLARRARSLDAIDASWFALIDETRASLGIARPVAVRRSDAVNVPAVLGVWRPVLMLPTDADAWTAEVRHAVALHELAHVARWDALGQLISQLACAVYWFIPLVWHGARRAASLRERASDDAVLRAGIRPSSYADNLLKLARLAGGAELESGALAMARPSRMKERVMAILDPIARRDAVTSKATLAILIGSAAALAVVAAIQPIAAASVPRATTLVFNEPAPAPRLTSHGSESRPGDTSAPTPVTGRVPASAVPPAPAAIPDPAQDKSRLCGGLDSSSTSIQNNSDGDRQTWTVKLSSAGCKVDMRVEGKVQFNSDFTDIDSLSSGGFLRLDVTDQGVRRQLDLQSRNGSLSRTYRVNGQERPYDGDARAWFAAFLIELDRRTGVGAEIRLPALVRKGGADAVLNETALMPSDYARGKYYAGLSKAVRLTAAELTRLVRQAAQLTKSDYYGAELIKSVARQGLDETAVRTAVVELIDRMESDHYRAESIDVLMGSGRPGGPEMDLLLRTLPRMKSDHYKLQTLTKILNAGGLDARQRTELARLAGGIESDYYAAEFLKALAKSGSMDAALSQAFVDAIGRIDSDHYVVEVINALIAQGTPSASDVQSILRAVSSIESDHYLGEALNRLLTLSALTARDLTGIVGATRTMESDHYTSETLQRVARHRSADEAVRRAVLDAGDRLSRHYADEVRRAAGR